MLKRFTKAEASWIMYDWANSAFAAIISAIILPSFFTTLTKGVEGAAPWWGYATSLATLVCAIGAPILGTLGDYKGNKKKFFIIFLILGCLATACLAFTANWKLILVLYVLGNIGFYGSNMFYDAFLSDVTTDERMDTVSTWGYALGYIGGSTIPLVISLVFIMKPELFGINGTQACQISFMITAVWWAVFSIPMLKNVKQIHYVEREKKIVSQTFRRLGTTAKKMVQHKGLLLFLLAYFFYIDGVGTIIHMATIFASYMGIGQTILIVVLMLLQIVAFPFAILYGRLAKTIGARKTLLIGICTYLVVCLVALLLEPLRNISQAALVGGFMFLAFLVGTAQGGIQALSRSYFGKLVPPESANEFFGFFDIFGKFSAVVGPALFSLVWNATGKVYFGIIPVACMFLVGMLLFLASPKDMEKLH